LTTTDKDFKVKNGLVVTDGGTFGGPVAVGTPTEPSHAVTKEYIDSVAGIGGLDGGTPTTEVYAGTFDGGTP
jgi:hypothetical protein